MIIIRFVINIYLINKDSEKYFITEKSFKYLLYLKKIFSNKIIMDFIICGSELSLSKDLTLKYFRPDEYIEFDQGNINYLNRIDPGTLNTVVGHKTKYGYNICRGYNPDLIILMKSNHFISKEWLEFIINDYDENSNKVYGLSLNYNIFIMTTLNSDKKIDISNIFYEDHKEIPPVPKIDAALIAIPRKQYLTLELNPINMSEVSIEHDLINNNAIIISPNNDHIFNIKAINENENVIPFCDMKIWVNYKRFNDNEYSFYEEKNIIRDINIINNL